MSEPIILIGGSGHAKVIIDCIRSSGDRIFGILDDGIEIGTTVLGVPVLGKTADYTQYPGYRFLVAIGSNPVRRRIAENMDVEWATVFHPAAVVSSYASVGAGTVVMANAVINPDAVVGNHCIINTGAIVEHDNVLEDYVHVSPGAALGGTVRVGNGTHIGIGSCVRNNVTICANCVIGAGSVVVKDIIESGTYIGVPARRMK